MAWLRKVYLKLRRRVDVELTLTSTDPSIEVKRFMITIKSDNYCPIIPGDEVLLSETRDKIVFFLTQGVKMYKDNSLALYRVDLVGDLYEANRVN